VKSVIIGIDHVLIAVEDLDRAMETWRRLGFQVLRGGEHPQFGTHNALVPLADGAYFELLAIKDPTLIDQFPVTKRLREVLACDNRLLGVALETDDLNGDVQAIRDRGLTMHKAPPGERVRPDGQRVGWRTAHPEDSRVPFLIQDQTPREVRVPAPTEGIGQSLRVACLEMTAQNPGSLRQTYAKLLGGASGDERFPLKRGEIQVASVNSQDGIHSVVLGTGDLHSITRGWQDRRVPFREATIPGYGLALIPMDTAGAQILVVKN
jgi:catechol 2,3-dioxygenase-like lactoylglutathione lyase family enzyme